MTKEDITARLKKIVAPYVQNKEAFQNFNSKTDFLKDLEINSANLVDIILDVEDEFDIMIDNEAMEEMVSVEKTLQVIQEKRAAS